MVLDEMRRSISDHGSRYAFVVVAPEGASSNIKKEIDLEED